MLLMLLLLCLAAFSTLTSGAIRKPENIQAMLKMRQCFNQEQMQLFDTLFPRDSIEREKREAIAFDVLGRLVKSGRSFCAAYCEVVDKATQQVEKGLRQSKKEEQTKWQAALDAILRNGVATREQCYKVRDEDMGPLSNVSRCVSLTMQKSVKALIVAQYRAEEEGF